MNGEILALNAAMPMNTFHISHFSSSCAHWLTPYEYREFDYNLTIICTNMDATEIAPMVDKIANVMYLIHQRLNSD